MLATTQSRVRYVVHTVIGASIAELAASPDQNIYPAPATGGWWPFRSLKQPSFEADSMDWIQLMMAIEEEFEIQVPDDDAALAELNSVNGLTAYVEGRLGR